MKKIWNLLWIGCLCCLMTAGCGNSTSPSTDAMNDLKELLSLIDDKETPSETVPASEGTVTTNESSEIQSADAEEESTKNDNTSNMEYVPETEKADTTEEIPGSTNAGEASTKAQEENDTASNSNGIRPEFKEALDSYEAFFDEYIAFMKKYSTSDDIMSMLTDYVNYLTQYAETMEKMSALESDDLSPAELAYYIEVTTRINEKLLKAAI